MTKLFETWEFNAVRDILLGGFGGMAVRIGDGAVLGIQPPGNFPGLVAIGIVVLGVLKLIEIAYTDIFPSRSTSEK
ncbi:hypothetical protein [Salinirubrum litoreum]|uniref:Uncharacterized protein n=1 Tax=Salinirubrum litoreum TaxID=1126234 RepID=A0ABD5RC17_9EURY|nr:hypothetical protein [Salinirubrum litoreum]